MSIPFQSGVYQLRSRPIILCLLLVCNDKYLAPTIKYLSRLGYCNSAINPVIYGLFSREFRAAFKKIICKFFCKVDLITAATLFCISMRAVLCNKGNNHESFSHFRFQNNECCVHLCIYQPAWRREEWCQS